MRLTYLNIILAFFISVSVSSALSKDTLQPPLKVIIEKSQRTLIILKNNKKYKCYKVALGFNPVGHKQFEGDGKTPEGLYTINHKNPHSKFHLSLQISYPNSNDRLHAKKAKRSPGGAIMIHGLPKNFAGIGKFHLLKDWTLGCIALTNAEIEEIWKLVPIGTPVEILP